MAKLLVHVAKTPQSSSIQDVSWHFTLTKLQAAMERVVCRLLQQQACNRAVD